MTHCRALIQNDDTEGPPWGQRCERLAFLGKKSQSRVIVVLSNASSSEVSYEVKVVALRERPAL